MYLYENPPFVSNYIHRYFIACCTYASIPDIRGETLYAWFGFCDFGAYKPAVGNQKARVVCDAGNRCAGGEVKDGKQSHVQM